MKRKITAGTQNYSESIFVRDTTSTTGAGLAGLVWNTAGLVAEYRRQGQSSWVNIPLANGKTLGSYLSGGIIADGSLAGSYEFDIPDLALASGARKVTIRLYGATNMLPVLIEVELDIVDYQTPRFGSPTAIEIRTEIDSNSIQLSDIKSKTNNLPSDPADASVISDSFTAITSILTAIAEFIDTEINSIKLKTDNLPTDTSSVLNGILSLASLAASGAVGTVQISGTGDVKTLVFKDTDGTTTLATVQWNTVTGARTRI